MTKPWANEDHALLPLMVRHILMLVDTDLPLSAAVTARPGVEIHHVASEDEIDC